MNFSKELSVLLEKEFEEFHIFKKKGKIRAAICIGSTVLSKSFLFNKGQLLSNTAIGGIRRKKYPNYETMLEDVRRLAYEGMTFKAAFIGLKVGGAKMVFRNDIYDENPEECYEFIDRAINKLNGLYLGAEDIGMPEENLECLKTPYILGRSCGEMSGDPAPFTVRSVFVSLETLLKFLNLVSDPKDFSHLTFAVQGFGSGGNLAVAEFVKRGAKKIFLSDKDRNKIAKAQDLYGNKIKLCIAYDPETDYFSEDMEICQKADIFIPCAVGFIINSRTTPCLQFKGICGSANNLFAVDDDAAKLHQRKIVCPGDFPVNNGGLVYTFTLLENRGTKYDPAAAEEMIDKNFGRIYDLLEKSRAEKKAPQQIAVEMAERKLAEAKIAPKEEIYDFRDEQIIKIHNL